MQHTVIDETGNIYGKLTVIKRYPINFKKRAVWECLCACGSTTNVIGKNLRSGNTRSCGCWLGDRLSKPDPNNAINNLFLQYKHGAKRRNLEFTLSKDTFLLLINRKCHYCGGVPSRQFKASGRSCIVFNGIDRWDNKIGYIESNCVSCCWRCNSVKSTMHGNDFISLCKVIAERFD